MLMGIIKSVCIEDSHGYLILWWLEQTDDIKPHQLLIEAAGEAARVA